MKIRQKDNFGGRGAKSHQNYFINLLLDCFAVAPEVFKTFVCLSSAKVLIAFVCHRSRLRIFRWQSVSLTRNSAFWLVPIFNL